MAHEHGHEIDGEFMCSICLFSSDLETIIDLHLEECHTLEVNINFLLVYFKQLFTSSVITLKEWKVTASSSTTRTSSMHSNTSESEETLPRFFDSPTKTFSDEGNKKLLQHYQ